MCYYIWERCRYQLSSSRTAFLLVWWLKRSLESKGKGTKWDGGQKSHNGLRADGCCHVCLELNVRAGSSRTWSVITLMLLFLVHAHGGGLFPLLCLSKTHSHHHPFQTHGFSSFGKLQLCIPLSEAGRCDSFGLEEVMFFSCAKPTFFGQNFERNEIQMHVGDQKVTLVKTHPEFFFCYCTITELCCGFSFQPHSLSYWRTSWDRRFALLLSLVYLNIHEFLCLIWRWNFSHILSFNCPSSKPGCQEHLCGSFH